MRTVAAIAECLLAGVILLEAFETLILARRSNRAFRITQVFYALTWPPFSVFARRIRSGARRENFLSAYGPVSLLALIGVWAIGLIVAFALLQWVALSGARGNGNFATAMYSSAAAFFTLGLSGSRIPSSRSLMILEAGLGFSFLGLVISYLPIFYQSYSSREARISLLDARAGSPPSAVEMIVREAGNPGRLERELEKWETWGAELLENQLAYPVLAYFRSQHANQSWLATLVTVLDTSALVTLGSEDTLKRQAELTFAMARHVLADLVTVFRTRAKNTPDRLSTEKFAQVQDAIARGSMLLEANRISEAELAELRAMYEPYAASLSNYFLIAIPSWTREIQGKDNWQASTWQPASGRFAVSDPFKHG